jgi:hypothetical protein
MFGYDQDGIPRTDPGKGLGNESGGGFLVFQAGGVCLDSYTFQYENFLLRL